MKNHLLALAVLFARLYIAQSFSIQNGDEYNSPKKEFCKTLDYDAGGSYFVTTELSTAPLVTMQVITAQEAYRWSSHTIMKVNNKTGKIIFKTIVEFKDETGSLVGFFNNEDKIFVFSRLEKGNKVSLLVRQLSSFTGQQIGGSRVVEEITDIGKKMGEFSLLNFFVSFSPDRKKMLAVSELKQVGKEQIVEARLYDVEMFEMLWVKTPIMNYSNSTVSTYNYLVDNNGNFTYLFRYVISEYKKDQEIGFGVGHIPEKSSNSLLYVYPCEGKANFDVEMEYLNDELLCHGKFFSFTGPYKGSFDKKKRSDKDFGFSLIQINPRRFEIKSKNFELLNPASKALLTYTAFDQYYVLYANAGEKQYAHYKTVYLDNCIYDIKVHTTFGSHMAEVIVCKYTPENKLEWVKVIPRGFYKDFRNLTYFVSGNKIGFLYIEDQKALELFPDANNYDPKTYWKSKSLKSMAIIYCSIDSKGNVGRKVLPIKKKLLMDGDPSHLFIKESKTILTTSLIRKKLRQYEVINIVD